MVQYRKGTRSRPQVKIPKQYHDDYEDVIQQPHSPPSDNMDDPLIPIEIIKTEPIDVVENDMSSFNIEETMETQFAESVVEPLEVNPLEIEEPPPHQQNTINFTPIKLMTQDTVAAIQIAECHSLNVEEQADENRRIDEGFENLMEEVFKTNVGDSLKTTSVEEVATVAANVEEKMVVKETAVDGVQGVDDSVVENHVVELIKEGEGQTEEAV